MILLCNRGNEPMKKVLHLVYSQGNKQCYPYDPKTMATLYHSQYRIYPKRTGNDPNKDRNINERGNENDESGERNPDNANNESPTGTAGAHVESGNDPNNEPNPEGDRNSNKENNQANNDNNGGVGGVHLTDVSREEESWNYTISEILGSHPIDDPI